MRVKVWHLYVVPVLLLGLAVWEYVDLTAWEAEGGVHRMNRLFAGLYKLGGKWAVVGVWAASAGVWAFALWQYIRYTRRITRQQSEAHERAAAREVAAAEESARAEKEALATSARNREKPKRPVAAPPIPSSAPRSEPAAAAVRPATDGDADEPSILKP